MQIHTRLYSPYNQWCDGNKLIIALKMFWKCGWFAIQTASMYIIIKFCKLAVVIEVRGIDDGQVRGRAFCSAISSHSLKNLTRHKRLVLRTEKSGEQSLVAKLTFSLKVKMSRSRNQRVSWGRPSESRLCTERLD